MAVIKRVQMNVMVDEDTVPALRAIAERRDRSLAWIVRQALQRYIDEES